MISERFNKLSLRMSTCRIALLLIIFLGQMTDAQAGRRWRSFKNWIDSADVKGTDPDYVMLPKEGFVTYANTYLSGTHVKLDYDHKASDTETTHVSGILNTRASALFSLSCSYRGWGLSYSRDLSHYGDTEWSLMTYGQAYGAEFRIHNSYSLSGDLQNEISQSVYDAATVDVADCHQKTILANAYYVGNHKHFSLPAALSHTVIQRRSCGSWLAIVNYHYLTTDIDRGILGSILGFDVTMNRLSGRTRLYRLRQSQVSIGAGYAYNYVFNNEHCLLHGALTPMLSVWHQNRAYHAVDLMNADKVVVKTTQIDYVIDQKMSVNASMNISFVYNRGRYLSGLQWLTNLDTMAEQHGRVSLYTLDSSARLFFGIRF